MVILEGGGSPAERDVGRGETLAKFPPSEKWEQLEVEMGCGKGKFLAARAQANPHIQFIGIDKAGKWMKRGIRRSEKMGLTNLVFIKGRVEEILEKEVAPETVDIFHIYFPDPWPKRRHHKRRLLTAAFFQALHARLKPGGRIELATDDGEYFQSIQKEIERAGIRWHSVRRQKNERIFSAEVGTNYEIKYTADGRDIDYLELCK